MPSETMAETVLGSDWEAETLRLTGLLPANDEEAADWWGQVVGEEPETTSLRRGVERRVEGPFRGRRLSLVVKPDRVDWVLSPSASDEDEDLRFASTGRFVESLDAIREVGNVWLERGHGISFQRLAFGAVLLFPVDDTQSGYRRIRSYLPAVTLDPEGSSDFSYRINRPRMSGKLGFGLRINRLATWSVAMLQVGTLSPQGPRVVRSLGPRVHACRLELDINTDAEYEGQLDAAQLRPLFQELTEYALEIAREGDKP